MIRSLDHLVAAAVVAALALGGCSHGRGNKGDDGSERASEAARGEQKLPYPQTRRQKIVETLHGVEVADPYRWLEDGSSEEVREWMDAQHRVTREYLDDLEGRRALRDRFRELFYIDAISAPQRRGARFFYSRRHSDREKRVHYWRDGEEGRERVLLDPNEMSTEERNITVGFVRPSLDGAKVAYSVSVNNADESVTRVMDVESGEVGANDRLEGTKYAWPQWKPDGSGFYYVYLPKTDDSGAELPVAERPGYAEVRFHRLGTPQSEDRLVYERTGDPKLFIGVQLSRDGKWLVVRRRHGWDSTELNFRPADEPEAEWRTLVAGTDAQYFVDIHDGKFYIETDEGAPRGRVFVADPVEPAREKWREIVAERDEAVLDGVRIIGGRLALSYLRRAHSQLQIRELDGTHVRDVELPGIGHASAMRGEPDRPEAYFSFQSFTRPPTIYETHIGSGATEVWADIEVPVDPSPYVVEQVRYPSKDGTEITMFVVRPREVELDGKTPVYLYGYGGFNVDMLPRFRASIYPWLEAGGIFAMPNLRGGGEYGEDWHRAGMLTRKQNVFDDFIAAAEYLVEENYTAPERIAISGGSNGGLLVGAAMTQRPDLFGAVICSVPLLDMVRYHLFGSGKTWIAEYGSAEDPEQFAALHAYSPYHRVAEGVDYPPLLLMSADSDDRVDPMHARKFAAAVQHATGGSKPALLRIERDAGHGGAGRIGSYVESFADSYAFAMRHVGLEPRDIGEDEGAEPAPGQEEVGEEEGGGRGAAE